MLEAPDCQTKICGSQKIGFRHLPQTNRCDNIFKRNTPSSGQIIAFHQPRFPWKKRISPTSATFWGFWGRVEVAILWPARWRVDAFHVKQCWLRWKKKQTLKIPSLWRIPTGISHVLPLVNLLQIPGESALNQPYFFRIIFSQHNFSTPRRFPFLLGVIFPIFHKGTFSKIPSKLLFIGYVSQDVVVSMKKM